MAIERQITVEDFTDVDQGSFLSKYLETKTDEGAQKIISCSKI